jgi:TPP-dependent pyruvate/acetoin dehydrogenase alpha subunit
VAAAVSDLDLFRGVVRIRRFEETLLERFATGVFAGTTHTCIGQEANAVGVLAGIRPTDVVVSNHRCHGHFLAYGGGPRELFAELMGRATGVSGGRGGSQHLHWRGFYSSGVLGGTVPLATGMALAEKRKGSGNVAVVFLGDGALGEGVVYEAINMASLWGAPVLFAVEHNHLAQSTPSHLQLAGSVPARFEAFGIATASLDTSDAAEIVPVATSLLDEVRATSTPRALVLETRRFGPHSKGDDPRTAEELAALREGRDPVELLGARLDDTARADVVGAVDAEIAAAFDAALADPVPELG